jgi:hypothetical protein
MTAILALYSHNRLVSSSPKTGLTNALLRRRGNFKSSRESRELRAEKEECLHPSLDVDTAEVPVNH